MYTATCCPATVADVSLIRFFMIPDEWPNRMNLNMLPTLWTVTKQLLPLNGVNLLHFHLLSRNDLNSQICFGVASNVAVDILLSAIFIELFIYKLYFPRQTEIRIRVR